MAASPSNPTYQEALQAKSGRIVDTARLQPAWDNTKPKRSQDEPRTRIPRKLPAPSLHPTLPLEGSAIPKSENTMSAHQSLESYMKTHLSFQFYSSESTPTVVTPTKPFPFTDDNAKSMFELRTTAAIAGLFRNHGAKKNAPLLELTIPGGRSVIIRMDEMYETEFARFSEALRGASCWVRDGEGFRGDCVVEAREHITPF
jgi:hypothetical protein